LNKFICATVTGLSILISKNLYCQETNESIILNNVIEEIAADASETEEASLYYEKLQELAEEPVNINSSDPDEISRLFFLNDFQVKSLTDYTSSNGKILTIYEIAAIPGFDRELATMMAPFVILGKNNVMSPYNGRWRNNIITGLSFRTADRDTSAPGSPLKSLSKYKFTAGSLSGGFTIEKDAGEKFFTENTMIPDFYSANLCYTGKGTIKKIIAGDFSVRTGQGTSLNTGVRTGLSLVSPGFMAAKSEIKPYTSTDENNFFRGAAIDLRFKNFSTSLFFSCNSRDATLVTTGEQPEDYIISFYNSGLHNTQSSLQKKDAVSIKTWGINISYSYRNFKIGVSGLFDKFSHEMIAPENAPEDLFAFTGNRNTVYNAYYNSTIKKILLFGEMSFNENGRHAFVQGVSIKPASRLSLNMLYRSYSPGFTSFHGKGPGVSSETTNEEGLTGNFIFEAAKHFYLTGGCIISRFPWLKYRCSAPSYAIKKEVLARYSPSDKLTIEALYNYKYSMIDNPGSGGIILQTPVISRSIKGTVRYSLTGNITFTTRADYKMVNPSGRGVLMLQDLCLALKKIPLKIWMRYCVFRTDNYDSRIYTYENDLLYSFSIPALSGSGSRSYIMIKWNTGRKAELRLRYGITSLSGDTGSTENREDIKMQLLLRF
jgi:hypothetical protein